MADEVHVGDIGTVYRCRCLDRGEDFDPTSATVKQLRIKMPGLLDGGSPPASVAMITKTATVEEGEGDEAGRFYLTYQVTAADVASLGFHSTPGKIKLQGYVEFASGAKYSSDIQTEDDDAVEMKVHKNLA
jgi:hypothetical protein